MSAKTKSIQGQIILDGGKLQRSFFHRAVVLVCQHDAEGAFGLVLNRSTGAKVGEAVVANLPDVLKQKPLFLGGPVQPGALSYLHTDVFVPHANVMENLNLGHSLEMLVDLGESYSNTQKIKMFAGYAGWSPGQLDAEMARQDWLIHPASLDLIFQIAPDQLWRTIMRQKGPLDRLVADAPDDPALN